MHLGYQITAGSRSCFCGSAACRFAGRPYPCSGRKMMIIPPRTEQYKETREKGNTQDTAGNDAPKCRHEKIFHPGIIRQIRRNGLDDQQIVILLIISMVARRT